MFNTRLVYPGIQHFGGASPPSMNQHDFRNLNISLPKCVKKPGATPDYIFLLQTFAIALPFKAEHQELFIILVIIKMTVNFYCVLAICTSQ